MTLKEIRSQIIRISQREMASRIGVSLRTYIRYENKGVPKTAQLALQLVINQALASRRQA